ncbi:MAG: PH domain-containing protein [Candidatus Schmidhempelia sp.]|nr:PH domain-containing protein [Candidatus Schmidhempelia sp.]
MSNVDNRIEKAKQKIARLNIPSEIKNQLLNAKVFDFWFNDRELKSLSEAVEYKDGEVIQYTVSGLYLSKTALLVCTNRRIFIFNKNMFAGGDIVEIPLDMINGVTTKMHWFQGDLEITNGAKSMLFTNVTKDSLNIMVPILRKAIKKFKNQSNQSSTQEASNSSMNEIEELKQLKELLDTGILTEEEFAAKKKQILNL